ncbi:MAG: hypothetical protein AB1411_16550 [Nitrospirota bacterium]
MAGSLIVEATIKMAALNQAFPGLLVTVYWRETRLDSPHGI